MMKEFKGKVAVVTGAASGIGRGLAEHCVKREMKVVLADIEEAALTQTEQALRNIGGTVLAIRTDVSKTRDIEALAQKTLDAFGAVHLLFNNAGVGGGARIWESTLADWEWIINVNLWGVIHGIRVFVPIMLQQQTECHIVNTASVSGLVSSPFEGVYRVTKFGVITLSETLYHELKISGSQIGVSVLCPGFVRTRILEAERNRPVELQNAPSQRVMTPEEQMAVKMIMEGIQKAFQNGMPPDKCAELVFKAIEENTFYILTHPEFMPAIRQRMEDILQGHNPTLPQPP
jgi:NAD(P)-dependent dehydrogenase (short-subunit alcohol dehydrogenase family)